MSVEIRQMVIKSNVVNAERQDEEDACPREDMEQMKMEIINECKRMMVELLREKRER